MIQIFTTGGTIGGLDYVDMKDKSSQNIINIAEFLEIANISEAYTIEHIFNKDSRHITQKDKELITEKINSTNTNKILITHGTYTLIDTAKYLGKLSLDKTIVLTGAFVLGTDKNTDASFNLGYAISSLQFLKPDVYITMNGQIFHHSNVIKNIKGSRFEEEN